METNNHTQAEAFTAMVKTAHPDEGDVWTHLDNAGLWPLDDDKAAFVFADGSELSVTDAEALAA